MLTIYEGIILFRNLPKDELATSVKRVAGFIFDNGGILRQLLYLGQRKTPYRQSKNKTPFWEAHYLYYEFNAPKIKLPAINDDMTRDTDVIKHSLIPIRTDFDHVRTTAKTANPQIDFDACTFEDENFPVPYRPEVLQLVDLAKRMHKNKTKKRIKLNINCDFKPFPQ